MNEKHEETTQRIYKIVMLIILTAFITFMITSLTLYTYFTKNSIYNLATGNINTQSNFIEVDKYLNKIKPIIENNYLWKDKINEEELKEGAIKGYIDGLGDKYTEYISKSEMKEFNEEINGSFIGIGIYMIADEKTQKIIVYYPFPDSPAEKAGIKAGDIIVSVDGKDYGYDDFDIIADDIRGKEDTKVKIVIERDDKQMEFEIERKKIEINPIKAKLLENNIGYIKISSFDAESSKNFKEKADELVKNGAKSLIMDLRNNGGGIVDESTNIAEYFLDKDKIIITTKNNKGIEETTTSKSNKTYDMPLVILVNENTASASEILTGALKDNNEAKIIGTKTYGKGVIQSVIPLSDGSGLKITTAEYYTPNRVAINNKGIEPDIEITIPNSVKNIYSIEEKDDTQLNKAIEELGH